MKQRNLSCLSIALLAGACVLFGGRTAYADRTDFVNNSGEIVAVSAAVPLPVTVVSGGLNAQYAAGSTNATPTGTVALGLNPSNVLQPLLVDTNGYLLLASPQLPTSLGPKASSASLSVTLANDIGTSGNPIVVQDQASDPQYDGTRVYKPKLTWFGSNGTGITTATTTTLIAAPSAGNHLRIYRLWVTNKGATRTDTYFIEHSGTFRMMPTSLAQYDDSSVELDGTWALPTATALDIVTSAAGDIRVNVSYRVVPDTATY